MDLELLKSAKGYKAGEPALVEFEVLTELLDQLKKKDSLIKELKIKNTGLIEQISIERKAHSNNEREYLNSLKKLENELDLANIKASQFLVSDLNKKLKNKKERDQNKAKKLLTKADLMLSKY